MGNSPNILLVEDEAAHVEAIRRSFLELESYGNVDVVGTLEGYRISIEGKTPDVAIIDLNLPDGRALEFLNTQAAPTAFPILIMTSFGDEHVAVEAMKAGALDYVVKSPEAFRSMPHIVERALREWDLLKGRRRAEGRIFHLNSVLRGIRAVNQLIIKEKDRHRLLQEACDRLVKNMGYQAAWIAIALGEGRLSLLAKAGLSRSTGNRLEQELAQGDLPESVRLALGQREVVAGILEPSDTQEERPEGQAFHEGVLAARMEYRETVYGVMCAGVPEEFLLDPEEQSLFHELVRDLSFALYRMDLEATHEEDQRKIQAIARFQDENPSPVVRLDMEAHLLYANPAAAQLLAEWDMPPALRAPDSVRKIVIQAALDGVTREMTLSAGDRIFFITVAPIVEHGYVNLYGQDITKRVQAEMAVRQSEVQTRAIYDHLPNAALVWKRSGASFRLAIWNEAAYALTQGKVATFLGKGLSQIEHGYTGLEEDLERCFQYRLPIRREIDFRAFPSASVRRLVVTYGFIPPDMVLLHAEDVTEERKTEEQLRVAQRMEAIGRLAGGIAHDFNNILSVIISYAGFAMDEVQKGDPLRDDLDEIRKAGERAAILTRQLLAFSRKQVLKPEIINLNTIIRSMEGMLKRLIGEDVELKFHLLDTLGNVRADAGQIEQVIMNLVVNARDAMPSGGKLIIETVDVDLDSTYVEQHVDAKPGPFVLLTVTDTGCGMDEAIRARIFEPFFTTKKMGEGTGLGLATVYGIVKQSGGNIWVYSEVNQGSAFKIYLPREHAAVEYMSRPKATAEIWRGTETILVVEDEAAVRNLAKRILEAAGYTVLVAASGGDALLISENHSGKVDLLFTDVVMPQMSGRALAERLVPTRPGLKVLYMSGYSDDAIVHHGMLDPGTEFITKPFSQGEVYRRVREVLDADIRKDP